MRDALIAVCDSGLAKMPKRNPDRAIYEHLRRLWSERKQGSQHFRKFLTDLPDYGRRT